jgi:Ser/Thr protein kinase RdoA (MazF antagonist)
VSDTIAQSTLIAQQASEMWPSITGHPVLFMHRENSVFKVETTGGPAALRVHRYGYHDKQAIESELLWMAQLAKNGLQIPVPILNKHKSYLTEINLQDRVYTVDLLTWLIGIPLGQSDAPLGFNKVELQSIFYNLGATIARLHDVSDAWELPTTFKRHAWDSDGFLGDQPFWGAFWNASGVSGDDRNLLNQAREKAKRELDELRDTGADYGLIHADFVRQNILVHESEVRIIDFDDSGFGFRIFDFATALVKNRAEPHYEEIKQKLFEGYRAVRSLSLRDEQSLDLFLTLRDLAYLGWADARKAEPGMAARLPTIRKATVAAASTFLQT